MKSSHIAGGGLGATLGVLLVALGHKIGLDLTNVDAASLGIAMMGAGFAIGHAIGRAWAGPGILPALRRGLFGEPKTH